MSLLNSKVEMPLVGKYEGKLLSYNEIENDKGGYVELKFTVSNESQTRDYTYCLFESSLQYFKSAIVKQLDIDVTSKQLELVDLLDMMKESKINMYFNWNSEYNRLNCAFHEPIVVESEDIEV